ncbi:arsenate reductase (glutaredoxin) [Sinomicrobium soli]|uniref:arsenate reductase (glutaredoxin) n=1 Tax=Sinomicrobium sp. N-1-3-6 TaxID=2219864 RepID=UPI000DCD22E4|nr:arsenate reductase (glutaredoxin) [Sinomicrobium sp. N-1-3-6]RAV27722.1 arsenate reductase (glutaredoxin) [Sinomicrobium sp. N-1-3-6]
MIKIYHNPRCSKSRQGLAILEASGKDFEVVRYLEDVPSEEELRGIIRLLGIRPAELVRTGESIWKEQYRGKDLSDDEVIRAMVAHPKLIERPIVVSGKKAVIGRPPEAIEGVI